MSNTSSDQNTYIPLSQLGILQVVGEEAQGFLQNLLTNDVAALMINQGQLSGFCNAKGRLFSVFFLIRREDNYQLVLPKTMCATLQQRLGMYVLRSKVTVTDVSDEYSCTGLISASNDASFLDADQLALFPSEQTRFIHIGSKEHTNELVEELNSQQWQSAEETRWELLDINAGLPMVYPETKEKFTPQQVNLDTVNGVSFKKGCYPGQEVVARLHYLGTPNRRMFVATAEDLSPITLGDDITNDNGDVAGQIVRIQANNAKVDLLVSLKISALDSILLINETTTITLLNKDIPE